MSINRVNLTGNLTRAADLRHSQSGTAILAFSVAVNDRRRNPQTGEWEDCPNYVDCVMFGARAESVGRFLSKGAKVAVEGRLRWSSWMKDDEKRSKLEVVVDDIEFMSRRNDVAPDGYVNPAPAAPEAPADAYAEDIPF